MLAKSIRGTSFAEIESAFNQSLEDGFAPTLAFVFVSYTQEIKAISQLLDAKHISIFGATTSGEFTDGDFSQGSIVILLLDMNREYFKILIEDYTGKDAAQVGRSMAESGVHLFEKPAFILSYGVAIPEGLTIGERLVRCIEEVTHTDTPIWGGVAGDDFRFKESFVFTNGHLMNEGMIMLILDAEKVTLTGQAAAGWKAVGTEKTITKANGNWIYEIDEKPAAEMVLKYMGLNLTKAEAETVNPGGLVVFTVFREDREPVMRSSVSFDWDNKSIFVSDSIKVGERIRLTLPADFDMIEKVTDDAKLIHKNELPGAEALLMFSCMGRLSQFGPMISDEINGVKNAFGVPMAGFFSYGEFGRVTGGDNQFHNFTCCWVALKENIA